MSTAQPEPSSPAPDPRFQGVARLYGADSLDAFQQAEVMIVGLGGVGCWAAEALARSGIGHLRLIDLDDLCPSNTNRQLHALDPNWGKLKVEAMAERIHAINPCAQVSTEACFYSSNNAEQLLQSQPSLILDCIDALKPKVHLILEAARRQIPLLISGAAGGRKDPSQITQADLARIEGDSLLRQVRKKLREEHGYPRGNSKSAKQSRKFGLKAVFSREDPVLPQLEDSACSSPESPQLSSQSLRLNCDFGYGTSCPVVASFGLQLAALALEELQPK